MAKSSIEWTESVWNPVTGCTKISPGCMNCYAERMAHRLKLMGQKNYIDGFSVRIHADMVSLPLNWKQPRTIFVNSMSDLFHVDIPDQFIHNVFQTMAHASWHTFQVLTKRSDRLASFGDEIRIPSNVWIGVSIENQTYLYRIDHLRKINASIKFISFEPLLGDVGKIDLAGIDWVIVGGESGPRSRPIETSWITSIRDQCISCGVPFFFKQWGGVNKKRAGRMLDGTYWDQVPTR